MIAEVEYLKLQALAETAQDIDQARQVEQSIAAGDEEVLPDDMVQRLLTAEDSALKIWRQYRGMTQAALGEKAGVGKSYISQIESGQKTGSAKALKALAQALQTDVDDLI